MFVLDTNVVSEMRRVGDGRADPGLVAWVKAQNAATLHISVLTLMELEIGVLRVERRDVAGGAALRAWLQDKVVPTFGGRILAIDVAIVLACARLHVPDPRSDRDALIAATAQTRGMTVVTRNIRDFAPTGVLTFNPFSA